LLHPGDDASQRRSGSLTALPASSVA
jgi:hypothetical protein